VADAARAASASDYGAESGTVRYTSSLLALPPGTRLGAYDITAQTKVRADVLAALGKK
jgi:hypothetical protein